MCYFGTLFERTDEVVDVIDHNLRHPKLGRVDVVVGIGLSGTMPLVPVNRKSGIPVCAMRKNGVKSHGGDAAMSDWVQGPGIRYVILDDFVESGQTLVELRSRIRNSRKHWECAGVILYGQYRECDTFTDVPILGLAEEVNELHDLRKLEKKE